MNRWLRGNPMLVRLMIWSRMRAHLLLCPLSLIFPVPPCAQLHLPYLGRGAIPGRLFDDPEHREPLPRLYQEIELRLTDPLGATTTLRQGHFPGTSRRHLARDDENR
jgi:hypothetical protein